MALASWHDEQHQRRNMAVETVQDLELVLAIVLAVQTERGHPCLELAHDEGNVLSLATDGRQAMLVHFTGTEGDYSNSAGAGDAFVFDYDGHWSEASPDAVVTLDAATDALITFLLTGAPTPSAVRFDRV